MNPIGSPGKPRGEIGHATAERMTAIAEGCREGGGVNRLSAAAWIYADKSCDRLRIRNWPNRFTIL